MSELYPMVREYFFPGCAIVGVLAAACRPLAALGRRDGGGARLAAHLLTVLRWAAGAAGICVGGALVAAALMIARESAASARWPAVSGRVLSFDSQSLGHSEFLVTIRYAYRVHGVDYVRDRVWLDQLGEGFRTMSPETWIRRFQPGTTVAVHYDAEHPGRSVLLPDALFASTAVQVILGTSIVGGGLSVPLLGRRRDRRRPESR